MTQYELGDDWTEQDQAQEDEEEYLESAEHMLDNWINGNKKYVAKACRDNYAGALAAKTALLIAERCGRHDADRLVYMLQNGIW